MAVAGNGQRSTRLSMLALILEGILEPGVGLLTFDYMGKRCRADLLRDGMIQWNGSKYSSPYAWASQCKNQVNPDHKSGIGWGHIRYKGIKLSQYKSMYIKKHQLGSSDIIDSFSGQGDESPEAKPRRGKRRSFGLSQEDHFIYQPSGYIKTENLKEQVYSAVSSSNTVAVTQPQVQNDQAALKPSQSTTGETAQSTQSFTQTFECGSFESFGVQQPFTVTVTSNTLMIMDFHSHICTEEVMGYLGGRIDDNTHTVEVVEAFPCKFTIDGRQVIEKEIRTTIKHKDLVVVGWYHSHPNSEANPTENDIICQKSYQEALQREDGDEPCIAIITGPNHSGNLQNVSTNMQFFYAFVVKHEEVKVTPIILEYSIIWEKYLTQEVVNELNSLVSFYKEFTSFPKFSSVWRANTTFKDKFKESLKQVQPKFPEDTSDETFMNYIDQLISLENGKKML